MNILYKTDVEVDYVLLWYEAWSIQFTLVGEKYW